MRNWSLYLAALALPALVLGFTDATGQSSGIARTLGVLLAALALFALALSFVRRRS